MDLEKQYSEGYAENNGVKIFYHDHGPADGEPIFIGSWFGSSARPLARALNRFFKRV